VKLLRNLEKVSYKNKGVRDKKLYKQNQHASEQQEDKKKKEKGK